MEKALRQFLVFFILICIVFLTVLTVQVFVVGKKAEPESELPDVIGSETPPPEETESAPPEETDDYDAPPLDILPSDDEPEETGNADELPPLQAGKKRVSLPLAERGTLLIDYYAEIFEHEEMNDDEKFTYISPEEGDASMTVSFILGQTAKDAAARYFDDAEGVEELSDLREQSVGRIGLTGQYVTAVIGAYTYEVWIVDVESSAVAFSIKYESDEQRDALQSLINAMELAE